MPLSFGCGSWLPPYLPISDQLKIDIATVPEHSSINVEVQEPIVKLDLLLRLQASGRVEVHRQLRTHHVIDGTAQLLYSCDRGAAIDTHYVTTQVVLDSSRKAQGFGEV